MRVRARVCVSLICVCMCVCVCKRERELVVILKLIYMGEFRHIMHIPVQKYYGHRFLNFYFLLVKVWFKLKCGIITMNYIKLTIRFWLISIPIWHCVKSACEEYSTGYGY